MLRAGSDALQVGVDLNLAAQTPWLAHQLQFVGGLGPRKAMAVLKGVQRQEQVAARKAVWKELNVIGKKVFWSVTLTVNSLADRQHWVSVSVLHANVLS